MLSERDELRLKRKKEAVVWKSGAVTRRTRSDSTRQQRRFKEPSGTRSERSALGANLERSLKTCLTCAETASSKWR